MGLSGKLVSQITIKSDGNKFYEFLRYRTDQLSQISPQVVQSIDLCEGQWGEVGCVTCWNFIHEGKKLVAKELIEAIDERKKSMTNRVIEGGLLYLYKTLKLSVTVDINGEDTLVTLTVEYEKTAEAIPDPHTLMDLCVSLAKDIDRHHMLVAN